MEEEIKTLRKQLQVLSWSFTFAVILCVVACSARILYALRFSEIFDSVFSEMLGGAKLPPLTAFVMNNAGVISLVSVLGCIGYIIVASLFRERFWVAPLGIFIAVAYLCGCHFVVTAYYLPIIDIIRNLTA